MDRKKTQQWSILKIYISIKGILSTASIDLCSPINSCWSKWIILSDVDITNARLIRVLRKVDIWLIYQSSSVQIFPARKIRFDFMPPFRKLHLSLSLHLACPGTTCLTRKIMFSFLWFWGFFVPRVWHAFLLFFRKNGFVHLMFYFESFVGSPTSHSCWLATGMVEIQSSKLISVLLPVNRSSQLGAREGGKPVGPADALYPPPFPFL